MIYYSSRDICDGYSSFFDLNDLFSISLSIIIIGVD
jgi:hypothetical protein